MYNPAKTILAFTLIIYLLFTAPAQAATLAVNNADIRTLLFTLASQSHLNLVLDNSVSGQVTLNLQQASVPNIIRAIAQSQHLTCRQENSTIYINKAASERTARTLTVNYLDLPTVAQEIALTLHTGETKTPAVVIDSHLNTVTFTATEQEYQQIRHLLATQDVAPRQIALEAKIVSLQTNHSKDLGIDWSWSSFPQTPSDKESEQHGTIRFGRSTSGRPYQFDYLGKLQALIQTGKAKLLAKPNITTLQGHEALINIGSEVPIPVSSTTYSTTTNSITYRNAGIILRCTPRINQPGQITVTVHTEVSTPLYVPEMRAYRFQQRSADTTIRLRNGETMVIGGLINSDETAQSRRVPLLSSLPIIGGLFKQSYRSKARSEIMIFLTAHELDTKKDRA